VAEWVQRIRDALATHRATLIYNATSSAGKSATVGRQNAQVID
jgi:hypothetical protein